MARNVITTLVDDLDGKSEASETVSYALDGQAYEIDLSESHAEALRKALNKYLDKSRKVSAKNASKRSTRRGPDPVAVRAWAVEQGMDVPERGRLSADVIEAYRNAQ